MSETIRARVNALGLDLPVAAAPAANYVPFVRVGDMLYVSGQLPMKDGKVMTGRVSVPADIETAAVAARHCALMILAQLEAATGGALENVKRCVKLGGFVASAPDFTDQSKIVNGASDLIVAVLGDAGRHARFAVGVSALPLGAMVEVDAVFQVA